MVGEIVHVEFPSRDFEKSSAFFAALFGWRAESEQNGGHLGVAVPGGVAASLVRSALAYANGPVVFVAVDDVAAVVEETKRRGGRVLVAKMNLGNRGQFTLVADPDGNAIAITSALRSGANRPEANGDAVGVSSGDEPAAAPAKKVAAAKATSTSAPKTKAPAKAKAKR